MNVRALKRNRNIWLTVFVVSVVTLVTLAVLPTMRGSAAPPAGDREFRVIADGVNAYLNQEPEPSKVYMTSEELMGLLDDNGDGNIDDLDDPSNDPLVVDVTHNPRYSNGHVPGAILVTRLLPGIGPGYVDVAKPANLEKIRAELANRCNKTIVLVCYTGTSDKWAAAAVGALAQTGYFGNANKNSQSHANVASQGMETPRVKPLKWGNLGWNTASAPYTPTYTNTYSVETALNPVSIVADYPMVDNTASEDRMEIVRVAGDLSVQATMVPNIAPGPDPAPNPGNISNWTILDIRSPADYAAGHVPGAINIPYRELFSKVKGDYPNLLSIDRSKQILVVGNAHQEAAIAAVALNMLGIRSVSDPTGIIGYGLARWNNAYGEQYSGPDTYPVVTGPDPGGLDYSACSAN